MSTENIQGKPVVWIPGKKILNLQSGFEHKLLCDGPTFSTGLTCAYSCSFCYVGAQLALHPTMLEQAKLGHAPEDIVVRRSDALSVLRSQLLTAKGKPRFTTPKTVFASPLVDVAANMELVRETIAACLFILELTPWTIRLLSKSNLLPKIAAAIPSKYKNRMIFGVSTGTLDDGLASAIEEGTPLVRKRIASLLELQDDGWRTFGMICPSLPQKDYVSFSRDTLAALRPEKLEHVWAEVLNARGASMTRTQKRLIDAGYLWESQAIETVAQDPVAWEDYARATFLAHTQHLPAGKLRFLQYVTDANRAWWTTQVTNGAVLL